MRVPNRVHKALFLGGEDAERRALSRALAGGRPGIDVLEAGVALADGDALSDVQQPDVVILDISGVPDVGVYIHQQRKTYPDAKLVALTDTPDRDHVTGALTAGAVGVLFKPADAEHVRRTILNVMCGPVFPASARVDSRTIFAQARVMLCAGSEDVGIVARATPLLRRLTPRVVHTALEEVVERACTGDAVVVCPGERRTKTRALIRLGASFGPGIVMIDDTHGGAQNEAEYSILRVQMHVIDETLNDAVCDAVERQARHCLRGELDGLRAIAPNAVRILDLACARGRPPRFVNEAAEFLRVDRIRAAREWSRSAVSISAPRLLDALDWILLWRVVLGKRPGGAWRTACLRVGLGRQRLDSVGRRLAHRHISQLLLFDDWRALSPFHAIRGFGMP